MTAYEKAVAQARAALGLAKEAQAKAMQRQFEAARLQREVISAEAAAEHYIQQARAFEAVAAKIKAQEEAHGYETQAH